MENINVNPRLLFCVYSIKVSFCCTKLLEACNSFFDLEKWFRFGEILSVSSYFLEMLLYKDFDLIVKCGNYTMKILLASIFDNL